MVLTLQIGTGRRNGRGPRAGSYWMWPGASTRREAPGRTLLVAARSRQDRAKTARRPREDRERIRGLRRPRQKMRSQKLAPDPPGREAKAIDHRQPEAAGWHGVMLG